MRYLVKNLAVTVLFLSLFFLSFAYAQSQTSSIIVHAHNPEGIEIASIQGMEQNSVEIYDGDTLIGYGAYNAETHNKPITLSSGAHTIKVKFNSVTKEETVALAFDESKILTFAFERTEFDLVGYLNSVKLDYTYHLDTIYSLYPNIDVHKDFIPPQDIHKDLVGHMHIAGSTTQEGNGADVKLSVQYYIDGKNYRSRLIGEVQLTGNLSYPAWTNLAVYVQTNCYIEDGRKWPDVTIVPEQSFDNWFVQPHNYKEYYPGLIFARKETPEIYQYVAAYTNALQKLPAAYAYRKAIWGDTGTGLWCSTMQSSPFAYEDEDFPDGSVDWFMSSVPYDFVGTGIKDEPALEILDGADFSEGREIFSTPPKIVTGGTPVYGAVTDGVTRLLLRLPLNELNEITFSLEGGTGNPQEDGILKSIDRTQQGDSVTITSNQVNEKEYAFCVYQAPENFVRDSHAEDKRLSERTITLRVKSNRSPDFELTKEIRLVRPPLILVHGLWSGPDMWWKNGFAFTLANEWPGIWIFRLDYESTNDEEFEVNKYKVRDMIEKVRKQYRSKDFYPREIAMVQADVLGYSMGGILARIYAAGEGYYESGFYRNKKNFGEGTINKLITLDSPHYGSFLAEATIKYILGQQHSKKGDFLIGVLDSIDRSVSNGAVEDLMATGKRIQDMNRSKITVPVHSLASHYAEVSLVKIIDRYGIERSMIAGIPFDYFVPVSPFDLHNLLIEAGYGDMIIPVVIDAGSDLVVSVNSQQGGLSSPASTSSFNHHHMTAANKDVATSVIELLNTDTDNNLFNLGFSVSE